MQKMYELKKGIAEGNDNSRINFWLTYKTNNAGEYFISG